MGTEAIGRILGQQCAPVIAGVKPSNLLIVEKGSRNVLAYVLKGTSICARLLYVSAEKDYWLLFEPEKMQALLQETEIRRYLLECGYRLEYENKAEIGYVFDHAWEAGTRCRAVPDCEPGFKCQELSECEPGSKCRAVPDCEPGSKCRELLVCEPGFKCQVVSECEPGSICWVKSDYDPELKCWEMSEYEPGSRYGRRSENERQSDGRSVPGGELDAALARLAVRFRSYKQDGSSFPHEMGVFLGYPIGDVKGFVENNGQNFKQSGYWKVYDDVAYANRIFELYAHVREKALELCSQGMRIIDIWQCFRTTLAYEF
ncbi:MAG: DUF3793 family protein [Lachnospiraceae bacterium]|nr:DUF3793 family protein [Lachnospiraceae bacterium]